MRWTFAGNQLLGGRRQQEDRWAVRPWREGLVAVVADGMGGHHGGAIASQLAVDAVTRVVETAAQDASEVLRSALDAAAASLLARIAREPSLDEMGCTLVAIALEHDRLRWISVGDSPFWIVDRTTLRRLNADHSMRAILSDMVREGRLTAEFAARHPSRNALRSVVGRDPPPLVDTGELVLESPREVRLLLASDGIETLTETEILQIVRSSSDTQDAVARLLASIDGAGVRGQDNTTIVVVAPDSEQNQAA